MQAEQASVVLQFLMPALEQEAGLTRKVIAAVPADKASYRLDDRSRSALELCWHIAAAETFFIYGGCDRRFSAVYQMPEDIKTPQDVVAWYDGHVAANSCETEGVDGGTLREGTGVAYSGPFPAIAFIQLMNNHSIHHRGQLSSYLRPMGAKVPSIYGTSRDDEEAKEGVAKA